MKKLGLFLLMAVVMCMSVKADDDRVITYQQLPQSAQEFLKQHFSKLVPLVVTMDWDDYTIMYESGEKIEFNKQGEWKDIDCRASHVPAVLIPQQIKSSVQQSFLARPSLKSIATAADTRSNSTTDSKLSSAVTSKSSTSTTDHLRLTTTKTRERFIGLPRFC